MKKNRKITLPPCAACDLERTESWLTTMAEKGWQLEHDGFFAGLAFFQKAPTAHVRYRLDAVPPKNIFDDDAVITDEKAELCADMGWEYVAKRGPFAVFRCTGGTDVPELHTDPALQAIALQKVKRSRCGNLVTLLFLVLFWLVLMLRGNVLLDAYQGLGLPFLLSEYIVIFVGVIAAAGEWFSFHRLVKKLQSGSTPEHGKNWKRHAAWHRTAVGLSISMSVCFAVSFIAGLHHSTAGASVHDLTDEAVSVPFATLEDIFPDSTFTYRDTWGGNEISFSNDLLLRQHIKLFQHGTITCADGTQYTCSIRAEYFETAATLVADRLFNEYLHTEKYNRYFDSYQILYEDSDLILYQYNTDFPTLLCYNGKELLHVTYYSYGETEAFPEEDFCAALVNSMKQNRKNA